MNGGNVSGGSGSGGDLNITGGYGARSDAGSSFPGNGGNSVLGMGSVSNVGDTSGTAGLSYGSGGSGGHTDASAPATTGGNGASGIVIVTEYYS